MSNAQISPTSHTEPDHLLRLDQVKQIVGLGKTMIYRLVRERSFPQPFKPGGVATRWSEREIVAWLAECGASRPSCA